MAAYFGGSRGNMKRKSLCAGDSNTQNASSLNFSLSKVKHGREKTSEKNTEAGRDKERERHPERSTKSEEEDSGLSAADTEKRPPGEATGGHCCHGHMEQVPPGS